MFRKYGFYFLNLFYPKLFASGFFGQISSRNNNKGTKSTSLKICKEETDQKFDPVGTNL